MSPFCIIPFNVLAENSSLFTTTVPVDSVMSDVARPSRSYQSHESLFNQIRWGLSLARKGVESKPEDDASDNYRNDTVQRNVDGTHTVFVRSCKTPGLSLTDSYYSEY